MKPRTPKEARLLEFANNQNERKNGCKKNKTGPLKKRARRARRRHMCAVETPRLVHEALTGDIPVFKSEDFSIRRKPKKMEVFTLFHDQSWPHHLLDAFFGRNFTVSPSGHVRF